MSTVAVQTPAAFKVLNDTVDAVENGTINGKRTLEEAENESPPPTAKKRKPAAQAASTPKGGKKGTAKKASPKVEAEVEEADDELETTASPPPVTPSRKKATLLAKTPETIGRKRMTINGETASPRGIPRSWEEATPADRMLFKWREDGKEWNEIRKEWKKLTGEDTGKSTLPNRYMRIKCNMMTLESGHERILLQVKALVELSHEAKKAELEVKKAKLESELEASKWASIADGVKTRTGTVYAVQFIQKTAKELEARGGLAVYGGDSDDDDGEELYGSEDEDEVEEQVVGDNEIAG